MTDHPKDMLLTVAGGAPPSPEVAVHLQDCPQCRGALDALSPVDLAGVWDGITAGLDAPRPGLAERAFHRLGLDASLARLATTTPSLSRAWLVATTLVLGLGIVMASAAEATAGAPALVVAPLVAAAAVAFAYGPGVDPAFEVVSVTPLSPVKALLVRLAAVLGFDALAVGIINLAFGRDPLGFSWLLPMAAAALLAAAVASRFRPAVGAIVGMAAWLAVLGVMSARRIPLTVLTEAGPQLVLAVAAVALLGVLVRRAAAGAWNSPGHAAA